MSEWTVPGYTEIKSLGTGGFGAVVLARHDATGTPVAVKYLRAGLLADPGFLDLFRAEAGTLASLDDPHVVRLYEYVESPAGAAIVMELVDGVTVRDILSRLGKTTPEAALVVLYGSLLGLADAHAHGVVHRDYKPANVLVNAYGASKLTDFGIAARSGTAGIAAGSLAYAPPEQFSGAPVTTAADVYAATATYYECLTGHPPFAGDTTEALLRLHRSASVPLDPVPEPLRPVIAAGMAKDERHRPESAAALAGALRSAAVTAYGEDWQEAGRRHLAEAALLLAALWPTGGASSVEGFTTEQVNLARGYPRGHAPGHAAPARPVHATQPSPASLHRLHLWHVLHLEHLAHLRYLGRERTAGARAATAGRRNPLPAGSTASGLGAVTTVTAAVAAVAVVAAAITVGATGGPASARGPAGGGGAQPAASASSAAPGAGGPLPAIALAAASSNTPLTGDVYVDYHDGAASTAKVTGSVPNAAAGEVVRLYAQPFPFSGAPVAAGSATLDASGGYAFDVTPTLATRYRVELFKDAASAAPVAASATTTIYVVAPVVFNYRSSCTRPVCHLEEIHDVFVPPSALSTEMSKQWLAYLGLNLSASGDGTPALPSVLQLGAGDPTFAQPAQLGPDEFSVTTSYTFTVGDGGYHYYSTVCSKDTEAQDGVGLPGSHDCGSQSIAVPFSYLG